MRRDRVVVRDTYALTGPPLCMIQLQPRLKYSRNLVEHFAWLKVLIIVSLIWVAPFECNINSCNISLLQIEWISVGMMNGQYRL
uniref:Uncharacterized protein n=1 Tax=Lactuca sativa TaxID=4236 RepID=A0A9R1X171_LACSA|nr:hypothetical protein LSAT_V11C800399520 [Lactuca sativa]